MRTLSAAVLVAVLTSVALMTSAPGASAAPRCTKAAAKRVGERQLLPYAERHAPEFFGDFGGADELGYVVGTVRCRDLTGDGRREMVVRMICCTGGSPSPWGIFRPVADRWRLSYARAADTVFRIRLPGRVVHATMPAPYEGACTRFVRDRLVRWSGGRFRSRVTRRYATGANC